MRTLIDIDNWERKEHYNFFSKFDEPFFGVTVKIDCTKAYFNAKENNTSFFLYYLFRALKAANEIENFKYRIIEDKVYKFDSINASPTIGRPNGTFGFVYFDFYVTENDFYKNAINEIEVVSNSTSLFPEKSGEDVIHFSAVPWVDFTSMSHARNLKIVDSCPKVSFGKIVEHDNKKEMAVSIHGHHGLMDGKHVGEFIEKFQFLLNN